MSGPTSNHALFRTLSGVFAELAAIRSIPPNLSTITGSFRLDRTSPDVRHSNSQERLEHTVLEPLVLPNENDRTILVDRYFATIGVVLPFVDRLALLVREDRPISRAMRALLNIVYAHAASTMEDWSSDLFYRRALALLDERTLRGSTLELGKELSSVYSC